MLVPLPVLVTLATMLVVRSTPIVCARAQDMEQMLLSEGDDSRLFHYGCRGSGIGVKLQDESKYRNQIPTVRRRGL